MGDSIEDQRKKTHEIVSEMTEMYKRMDDELKGKITSLEENVMNQEGNIKQLREDYAQLNNEKEDMIGQKDE